MGKNYFLPFFNDNLTYLKKSTPKSIFHITFIFTLLLSSSVYAQSTAIITAANNGNFEAGLTNWNVANQTTPTPANRNPWVVSTGATPAPVTGGNNSAYICPPGSATPPAYQYTNTTALKVSHLYRSVTIPVNQSIIRLNFDWKGVGSTQDGLRVYAVASTYTPLPANLISGVTFDNLVSVGGCACAYTLLGTFNNQPNWAAAPTITIPPSYVNTTFNLVFEWSDYGNTSGPNPGVPVSIDNVTLTSYNPMADNCANAVPLATSNTCNNDTINNVGATDSVLSGAPAVTCGVSWLEPYIGSDVWLSATVGGDGSLSAIVSSSGAGGMSDPIMSIYSGTCGALTLLQCVDDTNGLFPQINLTGQVPGSTVYIRIWPYAGSTPTNGSFNICVTAPNCFVPTVNAATLITPTTATINWAPHTAGAPSGGYQYVYSTTNTPPSGAGTPAAGTSAALTGLTQNTTYYVFVRSICGGGNNSGWSAAGSFTTPVPAPTTTGVTVCQGGAGTISATAVCSTFSNIGNNFSGTLNSATDPTAPRLADLAVSTNPCLFIATVTNYTSMVFQVTATGTYTFSMNDNPIDTMAYIATGPFIPGNCSGGGTFIAGDDDSGATYREPAVTATLTAGVTYIIYTQAYTNSSSGPFSYNVAGPGNILATTAGILQWWTQATGGNMIGTGTPFNPVGVAGSTLADTNTTGTTQFFAACSAFPNIRTAANFVINSTAAPTSVISGTGSACATTNVSIALTGTPPWSLTYTDGTTPVNVPVINTSPYTFNASPNGVATTYTVSALSNGSCGTAGPGQRTGSAVLYVKTWNGGTNAWNLASNWTPSGVPTSADCVTITNVGTAPIINNGPNYYAYADRLRVNNGAVLRVNGTNSLTVTGAVTVVATAPAGNIILDDDASLVQVTNVASNNNSGNITFNRTSYLRDADYVYWSSPFFALSPTAVSPGTNSYFIWKWDPSSPNANGGQGNWIPGAADTQMTRGLGYIIRAPDAQPSAPVDHTFTFTGLPNNGIITTPISRGNITAPFVGTNMQPVTATDDNWNLIGNPYPSSIDAIKFLTDNNTNLDILRIHLWTHSNAIGGASSSFYNNYSWGYADSYTTFNFSGPNPPGFGGKIASGQGFFVTVNETSPSVEFNNTMRGFDYDNTQFYKTLSDDSLANFNSIERSRIWFSILDEANANSTAMVCFAEGASIEKDRLFDAELNPTNPLNIYSLIGTEKMNIQGRPTFDDTDIVPVGYTAGQNGIYKVAIAEVDGLFADEQQDIYLEDTELNIMHDLRSNYYTFTTISGTFNDRFKLHFRNNTLGNPTNDNLDTFSYINNNILNVKSTKNIKEVMIFDIAGKLIKTSSATDESQNFSTDFNYPNGVYLIKIKLDNGIYVTKKQIK